MLQLPRLYIQSHGSEIIQNDLKFSKQLHFLSYFCVEPILSQWMKTHITKPKHISGTSLFITVGSNQTYIELKTTVLIPCKRKKEKECITPACKEQIRVWGKTARMLLLEKNKGSNRRKHLKYRSGFPICRRAGWALSMLEEGIGAGWAWTIGFAYPE